MTKTYQSLQFFYTSFVKALSGRSMSGAREIVRIQEETDEGGEFGSTVDTPGKRIVKSAQWYIHPGTARGFPIIIDSVRQTTGQKLKGAEWGSGYYVRVLQRLTVRENLKKCTFSAKQDVGYSFYEHAVLTVVYGCSEDFQIQLVS